MALELVFDSERHLDKRDLPVALDMSRKCPKNGYFATVRCSENPPWP